MTQKEVIKKFADYLIRHNIRHMISRDNGCVQFTMKYRAENAPGRYVESCIWFYDNDSAEARCYYSAIGAEICQKSEYRNRLLRLLNYINASVFLCCTDGRVLYEPHMLYTPRMYMTEDGYYDLTITTIINYDFWAVAPLETADYLTAYCPELLDKLAMPIFGVLLGELSEDEAITYVKEEILKEK